MSALAAVLAGRTGPAIWRWSGDADVAELCDTVERAGWRLVHYDGRDDATKAAFLAGIGRALGLPGHYGHNFDALADCLGDVGAEDGPEDDPGHALGTVLLWDGWGPFARADERAFAVALRVLGTRVGSDRGGPFMVLLRGDGPASPGLDTLV